MKVVRDERGPWLPARHRSSLAKLVALAMMPRNPAPKPGRRAYGIDRDQSALEQMTTGAWIYGTACMYAFGATPWWSWPLVAIAIPFALQWPFYLLGAIVLPMVTSSRDHRTANTWFEWIVLIALSSWVAASQRWSRYVAWLFFAVLAANAIAAVIVWLMRGRIAQLEHECGL